jgi:hypothetical protein
VVSVVSVVRELVAERPLFFSLLSSMAGMYQIVRLDRRPQMDAYGVTCTTAWMYDDDVLDAR